MQPTHTHPTTMKLPLHSRLCLLLLTLCTASAQDLVVPEVGFEKASASGQGVVAVWRKGAPPAATETPSATVGDTIVVRVRDLDGWIISLLDRNVISGAPYFTSDSRQLYLKKIKAAAEAGSGFGSDLAAESLKLSGLWYEYHTKSTQYEVRKQEYETAAKPLQPLIEEQKKADSERRALDAALAAVGDQKLADEAAAKKLAARDKLQARVAELTTQIGPGRAKFEESKQQLDTEGTDLSETGRKLFERQKLYDKEAALRVSFNALLAEVQRKLYLILDNSQFRHITPQNPFDKMVSRPGLAGTTHEMEFRLLRHDGDEKEWERLYDGTRSKLPVQVRLGIEFEGRYLPLETAVRPAAAMPNQRFDFNLYRRWVFASCALLLAGAVFAFVKMVGSSDIVRDPDGPLRPDGWRQFSLAKAQMAFWFFLAAGAYLILWLLTGRLDTLTPQTLTLIGIGSLTALGSTFISRSVAGSEPLAVDIRRAPRRYEEGSDARARLLARLREERDALEKESHLLSGQAASQRAAEVAAALETVRYEIDYLSRHFFMQLMEDWLSENGQIAFHRFQMLVWTLILGVIFVSRVVYELKMPEFSDTLLGLMGISAGTYIGFKVPEMKRIAEQKAAEPHMANDGKKVGKGK